MVGSFSQDPSAHDGWERLRLTGASTDLRNDGRERLGEALRRDGRLTRALLEAIPDLVFRLDREGTFLDFLPARGWDPYVPPTEFLGKNLREVLPSIAATAEECVVRALQTGVEQSLEYELPVGGGTRFFEARIVASAEDEVLVIVRDMTEKRSTAEKLRQSEERFRSLVDTAGDVIMMLSTDGAILEFNREAEKVFARARQHVVGKSYLETFVPESHHRAILAEAAKVIEGFPSRSSVHPIVTGDGRTRFISWNVDRLVDSEERLLGFIACGQDVTGQKELESSVLSIARGISAATGEKFFRHLVLRLAEILEADTVMLGELDTAAGQPRIRTLARVSGGKLAENVVYELTGSPCENVVGKQVCAYASGVQDLFPADRALAEQGIEGYVGAPLFDSEDRPLGLINVLYRRRVPNVTLAESILRIFATRASGELERKISRSELRASEQLNRRIVESMPGGILRAASDGTILLANDEAQRVLDLEWDPARDRFKDSYLDGGIVTEDGTPCPSSDQPLARCLATGAPQAPRVLGVVGPDATFWGLFTAVPLAGSDGLAQDGAILMFVDITDRKNAEEERRRLEAQIQHAQKLESLGVLAGGIAHDFNNLLTGILGNASLAMAKLPPGSDLAMSLGKIERAAERAAELTNQMLAYAGKGSFAIGSISLNPLVEELVPLLASSVSKKARLELDLDPDLPDIEGDRSQIEQVVMNLLTNASDALEERDGTILLRTGSTREPSLAARPLSKAEARSEWVFLEVEDSGVGMNEDTRARIFDPFFTTKVTGRGLGLAAVQGIVRSHRGRILVDSRPGAGTRITILFPMGSKPEAGPMPRVDALPLRGHGTVLVIDDEEAVREVARVALETAGYRVLLARDGIEGAEIFRAEGEAIVSIVLDVSMPRMSGEETLAGIRSVDPFVPVLLTSGYTELAARERFGGLVVSGFIQKPFRGSDLVQKIVDLGETSGPS